MTRLITLAILGLLFAGLSYWLLALPPVADRPLPAGDEELARGEYLLTAGGCISCHRGQTADQEDSLSGGLGIETDFGTFFAPNITPDRETGIGGWSARDFILAVKHGRTPEGSFYFPAFPYRSYAGLSDDDVLAMFAHLQTLEPVHNSVPEPELPAWLGRWTMAGWNRLADLVEGERQEQFADEQMNRGAYLARHLGHCGECHTPRNDLGMFDFSQQYAGATLGEERIEAIDGEALAGWTFDNFAIFLLLGLKPDGDFVGGDMNEVIEHNTSRLTDADREALAAYFTRHGEARER